jgi:hypothetical protein
MKQENRGYHTLGIRVRIQIEKWFHEGRNLPNFSYDQAELHLAWLFGYEDERKYYYSRIKHIEEFDALLGPHGYAIYRAMVIKRKMKDDKLLSS